MENVSRSNNIADSWYHSSLRVFSLLLALALVFESGILNVATQSISHTAGQQFATLIQATSDGALYEDSVMSVTLSEDLTSDSKSSSLGEITFLIATTLFIILLLLVLNYILVYLRYREHGRLMSSSVKINR